MGYESGLIPAEDLQHYDPTNDWDTQDSAFSLTVAPSDIAYLSPSICSQVDDGNSRARNQRATERQSLMRHVGDIEDWGSTWEEESPPLGINKGPRKTCTKCKRAKGLQYFYANPRSKDGMHSWCKECLRGNNKSRKKAS